MKRLRHGEWIAGIGALGLFATLFFGWFDVDLRNVTVIGNYLYLLHGPLVVDANTSGWAALGWFMDLLLVIAMASAFAMVILTTTARSVGLAVGATVLTAFSGTIGFIALVVRVLTKPGLGVDAPGDVVTIEPFAYVGIAFALSLAVGGWLALKDERTTAPDSAYTPPAPRPAPPAA